MQKYNDAHSGYLTLRFAKTGFDVSTITDFLSELIRTDPRNSLPEGDNIEIWEEPVLGVAAASDPLFETLKQSQVVGPIHATPDYWLPGAKSVVSFFLPFSKGVKKSYDRNAIVPSLEWVSGRLNGEVFVNVVRRALARYLERQGGRAIIPNLDFRYKTEYSLPNWSERHVAFVAGVGTFGHHCGLLTTKGAAGRIGSVVTDLEIVPTKRPYTEPYEYCLWHFDHSCGACMQRCPVGAISPEGKSHKICLTNGDTNIRPVYRDWGYHSCGHCQTHLPCSNGIPAKILRKRKLASIPT
jgi:epoxyqueuosine reductase QueG